MQTKRPPKHSFDSMAAWFDARRMIRANREMLVAIAGVFYLLPGLIGAVALPPLDLREGMSEQQMTEAVLHFYNDSGWILALLSLPLAIGFMTMLKVMLDPARPTVGSAIAGSLRLLPSYLAASLITGFALMFAWALVSSLSLILLPALLGLPLALLAMSWPVLRLLFVTPEIAVTGTLNPFRAIRQSAAKSRGAFLPLLSYFAPALMVFFVACSLLMLLVAVVLSQISEGEAQRMISEGIFYVVFAAGYTLFAALIASAWKQLGPPADA